MRGKTFYGLAAAGLAGMGGAGGNARGQNSVIRSGRARRRAYNKELEQLKIAHQQRYGAITEWPQEIEEAIERQCKKSVSFAIFIEGVENLQRKWFE